MARRGEGKSVASDEAVQESSSSSSSHGPDAADLAEAKEVGHDTPQGESQMRPVPTAQPSGFQSKSKSVGRVHPQPSNHPVNMTHPRPSPCHPRSKRRFLGQVQRWPKPRPSAHASPIPRSSVPPVPYPLQNSRERLRSGHASSGG